MRWQRMVKQECLQLELAKTKTWKARFVVSRENVRETGSSAILERKNSMKSLP